MPSHTVSRPVSRVPSRLPTTGVGFNLDAYLASLSNGFRFNTRKTDRYFQQSTGPTLADDVGETIGLALSQRLWGGKTLAQVVAAQSELVPNPGGPFTSTTDWTPEANAVLSVSGGELVIAATSSAGSQGISANLAVGAGKTYQCTFTLRAKAGNSQGARLRLLDVSAGAFKESYTVAAGQSLTQTFIFVAASSNYRVTVAPASIAAFGAVGDEAYLSSVSIKEIPGNHALQTGASTLCPIRQAEGAKFDASDDNWLMTYLAASGANFIQARTTVPASLAATQVVAGASGSSANRVFLGVNTSGFACAGVGSDSTATIVGSTDLRGSEADIAVTFDGSTVRLIANGVVEYEAAQNSTPTTTIPFRIGALNNNGTAGSFYGGAVKDIAAGTDYLTLSRFNEIRAVMAANR